jgi:hypothetical protein
MSKKDVTVILEKPRSLHPDDAKLSIVLAKNAKGEFVTWSYSAEFDGFDSGHYFGQDLRAALDDYDKRGCTTVPDVKDELIAALEKLLPPDVRGVASLSAEEAAELRALIVKAKGV